MSNILEEYMDYRLKIVVGFFFLIMSAGLLLETVYSDFLGSLTSLFFIDEYSYLIIALITIALTLYLTIRHTGLAFSIMPSKIIVSILFAVYAILFYFSAYIDRDYMVQFQGISFTLVFLALISLVYNPVMKRDLVPLLSLLFIIPPPPSIIDILTPTLSRYLGMVAAYITGAKFIAKPGFSQIMVNTPSGSQVFNIETACTGIVTMSSVIAVTPIILYLLAYSPQSNLRKTLALILSIIVATIVGLLGNLIRILLIIYGSRAYGVKTGLEFFHYSPSIIYAFIATIAAFYIADRLGGMRVLLPRPLKTHRRIEWRYLSGVIMILVVFTSLFYGSIVAVSSFSNIKRSGLIRVSVPDPNVFTRNPSKYIFNGTKFRILTQSYSDFLTRVLGALTVYSVIGSFNDTRYFGYIELVDTLGKLHTWQFCLRLQGNKVERSWSKLVNGTLINYILIRRGSLRGLIAYTSYPVELDTPSGIVKLYARVSILRYYSPGELPVLENTISGILSSVNRGTGDLNVFATGIMDGLATASYLSLIGFTIYVLAILLPQRAVYKVFGSIMIRLKRREK